MPENTTVEKKNDVLTLNCFQAHAIKQRLLGGDLYYGWAVGPDEQRYQHTWLVTDAGDLIDLFNWTEHAPCGIRQSPEPHEIKEWANWLRDNYSQAEIVREFRL